MACDLLLKPADKTSCTYTHISQMKRQTHDGAAAAEEKRCFETFENCIQYRLYQAIQHTFRTVDDVVACIENPGSGARSFWTNRLTLYSRKRLRMAARLSKTGRWTGLYVQYPKLQQEFYGMERRGVSFHREIMQMSEQLEGIFERVADLTRYTTWVSLHEHSCMALPSTIISAPRLQIVHAIVTSGTYQPMPHDRVQLLRLVCVDAFERFAQLHRESTWFDEKLLDRFIRQFPAGRHATLHTKGLLRTFHLSGLELCTYYRQQRSAGFPDLPFEQSAEFITLAYLADMERHFASILQKVRERGEIHAEECSKAELATMFPTLTVDQLDAVHMCATEAVCLLAGYAGTGKTHTAEAIVRYLQGQEDVEVVAATLSGMAAQTLERSIGLEARTTHYLVLAGTTATAKKVSLLLDEASMLDFHVTLGILHQLQDRLQRVIFIGDDFQLPPIARGHLFRSLLQCKALPRTKLTHVFRSKFSAIAENAMIIRQTAPGATLCSKLRLVPGTFEVYHTESTEDAVAACIALDRSTPAPWFLAYTNDVVGALNCGLQDALNPPCQSKRQTVPIRRGKQGLYAFRVGDRVICTKNYYSTGDREGTDAASVPRRVLLCNGSVGVVRTVSRMHSSRDQWCVAVQFPDVQRVTYMFQQDADTENYNQSHLQHDVDTPAMQMEHLLPAWAITVHKSQSIGKRHVVLLCHASSARMNTLNIIYTGVTRAVERVTIFNIGNSLDQTTRPVQPTMRLVETVDDEHAL